MPIKFNPFTGSFDIVYDDTDVLYKNGSRSMTGSLNFSVNNTGILWLGGSQIKEEGGALGVNINNGSGFYIGAGGVDLSDVTHGNLMSFNTNGFFINDKFSNYFGSGANGFYFNDVFGNYITTDASGITFTAPLVKITGSTRYNSLTASTVPYLNALKDLVSSAVTPTELSYLSGATSAIQPQLNASLKWVKYDINFTSIAVASATTNIELAELIGGGVLHSVKIKHSTSFVGGLVSQVNVSIGISTNLSKYASAFDIFQIVAHNTLQLSESLFTESHSNITSIRAAFTSVGGNLNTLTSGVVSVWLLISKPI